jgi:hypothetical protein
MKVLIPAFLLIAAATAAHAQAHHCSDDAIAKATLLLRLHGGVEAGEPVDVEKDVKVLAPIKALKGSGRFDVFEVWGHIYKAAYRMRLIYAQIKDSCVLMDEEILEASDPY